MILPASSSGDRSPVVYKLFDTFHMIQYTNVSIPTVPMDRPFVNSRPPDVNEVEMWDPHQTGLWLLYTMMLSPQLIMGFGLAQSPSLLGSRAAFQIEFPNLQCD